MSVDRVGGVVPELSLSIHTELPFQYLMATSFIPQPVMRAGSISLARGSL